MVRSRGPAGIVGAQGAVPVPDGGETGEVGVGKAGIGFGPAVASVFLVPILRPLTENSGL
jgi:hypothetical protein